MVLEYIEGPLLSEMISKIDKNFKIKTIFEILIVVHYLHSNNFIYRDLKPNNIIINRNNTIVLIDLDRMVHNSSENEVIESSISFHNYFGA